MTAQELYQIYRTVPSLTLAFAELPEATQKAWERVAVAVSARIFVARNAAVLQKLAEDD